MYKTSHDRRFIKNKKIIRRAFIDLVIEKGYNQLTVTEIAEKADINRMTFYSHYDSIEDIFYEFIDDMEAEIYELIRKEEDFSIDILFEILNKVMYEEIDFYRCVARDNSLAILRKKLKDTINQLIRVDLKQGINESESTRLIMGDLTAVCIAYSYFDWLTGEYGDVPLSEVTKITKNMLSTQLLGITIRK